MKIPVLDLNPQYLSIKEEVQEAIARVLESGQFIMGPDVKLFEQEVAEYLNVKHAIGVNSGTDALVIGLKALDIGPGDEVITTPFSFFATAESINNVGATPIFADVDAATFNIDPLKIEEQITPRTRAIMPVHLYGRPAEMESVMQIAQKHSLKVIEDCAQSFGAVYYNNNSTFNMKYTGTIGDVGAFSFFPSKNLGAYGDGGMIVTNNDHVAELASMLRVHGAKKKYFNERLGYNSRLDTLQAAILRIKLKYIDRWNYGRQEIAKQYNFLLSKVPFLLIPEQLKGHVFHQYTIRIVNKNRDKVKRRLEEKGVYTMIYYPTPQDQLPIYKNKYAINPISDKLAKEVLSLPIWPELERENVLEITKLLNESLKEDLD